MEHQSWLTDGVWCPPERKDTTMEKSVGEKLTEKYTCRVQIHIMCKNRARSRPLEVQP